MKYLYEFPKESPEAFLKIPLGTFLKELPREIRDRFFEQISRRIFRVTPGGVSKEAHKKWPKKTFGVNF